ncbi:hypothetical protein FXO37_32753 [Capsicum annuum]|uniref:homeobox-leucine zipper protein ROC7-like n=1 Tax=Capsicum annuum TaxID=4072 RepID=UPI0007BEBD50|nr:homeobox-leucine zipper protein ROC7-like [Capsicum annuum]KAF3621532.1 hypothetical protein FXO37_32753 [Capsicum annuum]
MASQDDENVGPNSDQKNEKSICRYSFEQVIEKLEEMFSKMSDPESDVIEQLSGELGLDITQVKIWFDNKRYQIQAQRDMEEREILRLENEILHAEILQIHSELNNRICANCDNPEQEQILQDMQNENENATITDEITMMFNMIDHIEEIANDYNDDSNSIDLELRLKRNDDPNGPDLELRLG